jgi:acetoin utilization deacetylase AcuC-like enzyme
VTAANRVLEGEKSGLVPSAGASRHADYSGGYRHNNTAIAAKILSVHGPVAVPDIDYHHGNGAGYLL